VNLAQDVHARLTEDPIAGREMLRNLLGEGMMKLTRTATAPTRWSRPSSGTAWRGRLESPGEDQVRPGLPR
jgi:hypothetical protein